MDGTKDPEESKLMLMVNPTTGKLLLVMPSNIIGFSGIASVDSFADQLNDQLVAVKRLLEGTGGSSMSADYGSQVILEWEDFLKHPGSDNEAQPDI